MDISDFYSHCISVQLAKTFRWVFGLRTLALLGTCIPTPGGKSKGGLGLLELPYDTFAAAGARDLKFSTQLEFSKAHHKTTPREKGGVAFG